MSNHIRIRPDATSRILADILGGQAGDRQIDSVSIDVLTRTLTVTVSSDQSPEQQELDALSAALADRLGNSEAIFRVIWQPKNQSALIDIISANQETICRDIAEALPALKGCVSAIDLIPHGEHSVEVVLPGQVHAARAAKKQFRDALAKALSDSIGRRIVPHVTWAEVSMPEPEAAPDPEPQPGNGKDMPVEARAPRQALLGRGISQEPTDIKDVSEDAKGVVVEGRIFDFECKAVRNSTYVSTFNLTDGSDSVTVKHIGKNSLSLKDDSFVKVRGDMSFDKYAEEAVLLVRDIVEADSPPQRMDQSAAKRVELHLHTKMSSMDAVLDLEDALRTLKKWGHSAVAITDHGVVQAFPLAHEISEELGLKIIYGIEGYLVETDSHAEYPRHIVLLALDLAGLKQLYKLVSLSHLEHFYKRPRMLRSEIEQYRSHLLVGSACEAGEIYRALLDGASDERLRELAMFYDYLEIQPVANNLFLTAAGKVTEDDLIRFNQRIYEAGRALGKPVVAAGDVHFLHPEDEIHRRVLITAQGFEGAEKDSPLWLRTTQEMLDVFGYLGEEGARRVVVEAPNEIASRVENFKPVPSGFYAPDIPGAQEELDRVARAEAHRLYGDPLPEPVSQRLERELAAISGGGFAAIYVICRRLVQKSTGDGYLVGSRGSVGSSFVAGMFGITEVNPLAPHYRCPACKTSDFSHADEYDSGFDMPSAQCPKCGTEMERCGHKIAFEVFMGFKGDKVPDIDLNFSGENQGSVIKYTEELLGKGNVFRAGTIATVADRTAFGLVKAYCEASGSRPRKAEMARLARGITGVKRTTGQHPGGVLILPEGKDILDFTPIQYPADDRKSGTVTTHFDYESISSRLLKMDILGHDDPTALRMLHDYTGVDPRSVPFHDKDTMSIFSSTDVLGYKPEDVGGPVGSIGIPEFGTRFVRQMLADTRPRDFSGLVRISGLSHGTDVWLNNAQDIIRAGGATLADVICARDDILNYLSQKGIPNAQAFKIMENVRKGRGISADEVKVMENAGVPGWYVESCRKIKYLFPKAHAAAYVMMAFRIAYFKVHYPEAFYAQYLSLRAGDVDLAAIMSGRGAIRSRIEEIEGKGLEATAKEKDQAVVLEVAQEMLLRGIGLMPVSLYESDATHFMPKGKHLLPPFLALPGMGQAAARNLVKARDDGPFLSVEDLRSRAHLQRNVVDLLRTFGCFSDLPECNQIALL